MGGGGRTGLGRVAFVNGDDFERRQVQVCEAGILEVVEVPLRQGVPAALVLGLPALLKQGGLVEGDPAAGGAGGQEVLRLLVLALGVLPPAVGVYAWALRKQR